MQGGHVISPNERKLREVFDCIEKGNNKVAIKHCDTLINKLKDSNSQLPRVLKAIALERMGKDELALKECEILQNEVPIDEDILRKLSFVYRSLNRMDLSTKAYENAYNKQPSELLAKSVFVSFARELRFNDQRTFSFKLMKQFPKKKQYYFFAAVSYIQQIQTIDLNPSNMNIIIASKTLEKIDKQFGLSTIEELLFVIYVYDLMDKYDIILTFIEKYSSLFKYPGDYHEIKAKYLMKVNKFDDAKVLYKELLIDLKRENWKYYSNYLYCLCQNNNDITKDIVNDICNLLTDIQSKYSIPQRLTYLGKLDIHFKLYNITKSDDDCKLVVELINEYISLFGHKKVCFRDLQLYLQDLPIDIIKSICNSFENIIKEQETKENELSIKYVYRIILLEQLKTKFNYYKTLNEDEIQVLISKYLKIYNNALQIPSAKTLTETERQYGDDLIILSAHLYISLYLNNNSFEYLINALAICNLGLEHSKFNFQIKIIAMRIYCLLGAIRPCIDIFRTLDIKHIQMDTFTHIVLDDCLNNRISDCTEYVTFGMDRFYGDSLREMPELVTYPYTRESYSRAREFRDFYDKIANTVQRTTHNIEYNLYEFLTKCTSIESAKEDLEYSIKKIPDNDTLYDQLYQTADNSFWDNWHSITELSSPYIITSACLSVNDNDRLNILKMRGYSCHLMLYILQNEPEMAKDAFNKFKIAYDKIKFDEYTKPLWNQVNILYKFATNTLSTIDLLKHGKIDKDISESLFTDLDNIKESLTNTETKLNELIEHSSITGIYMPLFTLYSTTLCWIKVLFNALSSFLPNRLKKTASSESKDIHRKLKNNIRITGTTITEKLQYITNICKDLSSKDITKEYKSKHNELDNIIPTIITIISNSIKESYSERVKLLNSIQK